MVKFAQMPKYEAYKDSGVEWIGEIPAHWQLLSLKRIVKEHSGNGFPIELQGQNGNVPFLKVSDIGGYGHFVESSNNYVSQKTIKQKKWNVVPAGSLVTAKIGEAIRKNHRKLLIKDSVIDNNCIAFECIDVDVKFNFYMHLVIDFEWFVNPGAVPSISVSKYKTEKTAIPPINEQNLISNFLDQKTAQIDAAIAIKEQQIELLKERKQIIIQQAVTQGLDPNVPMKDSGVEWIGQIPEHWEVLPLKRVASLSPSVAVENKKSKDLVCFLPMEKVSVNGEITCDTFLPIKDVSQGFTVFNKNDVIVAKITPCFENGKSAYLDRLPTEIGYGSTEFHVLRCSNRISGRFLYLVVSSHLFLKAGEALMTGSAGQKRVPSSFIANFPIATPSIAEQSKIIDAVDRQFLEINNVINASFKQIQKLKEYKTTLINGAVTGKIKITPEMLQA